MITKKIAYLLLFLLIFSFSFVNAAEEDSRYLIKSYSGFWKKSFGVRNEFSEGFTADLSDWQIRVARVFGVELVPVKKLYVLPESFAAVGGNAQSDKDKNADLEGKTKPSASPRPLPSSQLPWGIKSVYGNDPLLVRTSGGAGVLKSHPDLKSRIFQCKDFTNPRKPIIDGQCDDKNGHGTHVAGIIAADGGFDKKGIYGVAPEASLFTYRVCGANGSCWSDDIAVAIRHAADNNANVINMSLGSDSESSLIRDAIGYAADKNVLVIAAAGNDGPYIGSIDYPGANPNVAAIGAFDVSTDIAEWSSRGVNSTTTPYVSEEQDIEFAAPGVNIESTWKDGSYVVLSGTSMASPHMAGLAAKLWQKSALDPDSATRDLLRQFSQDLLPVGDDDASGWGFSHL